MKILFVLGFPNPFPGAGWIRIGFFAEDWSKKGHSIDILGSFSYEAFRKKGIKKFNRINIFNMVFTMGLYNPLIFVLNSTISFIISMPFLLVRRPSITIVSLPTGDIGLGVSMACRLLKIKYVIDYRDEWEDYAASRTNSKINESFYFMVKTLMTNIYSKSHLVVTVTSNLMLHLIQRGITNIRLVPNGADTMTFKSSSIKEENENSTIFYSGVIGEYYSLDLAVKSIKKLIDDGLKNIRLVIAGEGEIQKVLDLALRLNVLNNIVYLGPINDKTELAQRIANADVGLIPYDDNPLWKNSLPAKFFEYCACGIPVIATAYEDSLLAMLIRKYEIGLSSPPMDEESLAEAIYWLYKNKSFRDAAGKRARALIEEKFDRNKISEEFLNLVETLL